MTNRLLLLLAVLIAPQCVFAKSPATTQSSTTQPVSKITLEKYISNQLSAIQLQASSSHDYAGALDQVDHLFAATIAYSNELDSPSLTDLVYTRRLLRQFDLLQLHNAEHIDDLWKLLADNPAFAHTLVFAIKNGDEIDNVYSLVWQLYQTFDKQIFDFTNLTVAIGVVHDRQNSLHLNENRVVTGNPVEIFQFYTSNEKHILFNIRKLPPDLLIYMVDNYASASEMQWAIDKYAKDPELGKRYFEIKYDTEHYLKGTPKKISQLGFNLQNILKYGGICVDQAYYASSVGKAIGVPTAYITARSGEVGHAWIGYLAAVNDRVFWNFNAGRYEEFKSIRGNVIDPQTQRIVGDGYIALTAELQYTKESDRFAAIALSEAENYLLTLEKSKQAFEPVSPTECSNLKSKARENNSSIQLELLALAVKRNMACVTAWNNVIDLAEMNKLSLAEKRDWANQLIKACSAKYPDFTFDVLEPMVTSIEDPREQLAIWNNAYKIFQARQDISASIRMKQASIWEKLNDPDKAGQCYEEILTKFPNAGPFVMPALEKAEEKLIQLDRRRDVTTLYSQTWSRIPQPGSGRSDLIRSSNWYKVGKALADKLAADGQDSAADKVRQKLPNVDK